MTNTADSPALLYRADALRDYASALLQKAGLAASMADSVARTLVEGDLLGHDTHGLALLAGYVKEIESGGMTPDGAPEVLSDRPAAVLWDGRRCGGCGGSRARPGPPPCSGTAGACPAPGSWTRAWTC
jgi:LDH2 family malate/lactate/ureidoglycolate dehydrogenase